MGTWVRKNVLGSVPKALFDKSGRAGNVRKGNSIVYPLITIQFFRWI
jgi:hypothetical protein